MLDQHFLEELKNKNEIVEVISHYCTLEQRGGSFWARCPLPGHSERTPSFSVNQFGQFYHCFGCGRGGDVIRFVMEMEALSYIEAVRYLAERVGMELPDTMLNEKRNDEFYKKKDRLLACLKETALFYVSNLKQRGAEKHLEYIAKRGLQNSVSSFGIGASLDFDSLPRFLESSGFSREEMTECGVVSTKDGRYFDALGGRLIFPIINNMGEVVAFGGRLLEKSDFAKYKNTNNNTVFVKNKTLYNINQIKKLRSEGAIKELILVEGYMDTVSLFASGFKNVVASMGTSLTKEQARLIKRYTENVLISYDGDFAGQTANVRGLEILTAEGINVRVVSLPEGLDPDDVIKQRGAEAYQKCLDEAMPLIDFKLSVLDGKFDVKRTEERRKYIAEALKVVRESASEAEREELLKKLSERTRVSYQSLRRDLDSVQVSAKPAFETSTKPIADRFMQAERYVLAALLSGSKQPLIADFDISSLSFSDSVHIDIAAYIIDKLSQNETIFPSMLYDYIADDGKEELGEVLKIIASDALNDERAAKYFTDCVVTVKRAKLERDIDSLKLAADASDDADERKQLTQIIMEKTARLIAIK